MNIQMRGIGQIEQSYDRWNEWKSYGKNLILNNKMKSPGEIDFLRFCIGFYL